MLGLLNATCTIKRPTYSADSASGAPVATWADAATGVRCSIQAVRASESRQLGRDTADTEWKVYFVSGTDVRAQDRLTSIVVDGSATDWSGRELSVSSPPTDDAGRRAYTKVYASERKGGGLA